MKDIASRTSKAELPAFIALDTQVLVAERWLAVAPRRQELIELPRVSRSRFGCRHQSCTSGAFKSKWKSETAAERASTQ